MFVSYAKHENLKKKHEDLETKYEKLRRQYDNLKNQYEILDKKHRKLLFTMTPIEHRTETVVSKIYDNTNTNNVMYNIINNIIDGESYNGNGVNKDQMQSCIRDDYVVESKRHEVVSCHSYTYDNGSSSPDNSSSSSDNSFCSSD